MRSKLFAALQKRRDTITINEASRKCLVMVTRLTAAPYVAGCAPHSVICLLGFVTKLSSAGLVYKHFGKELVAAATGHPADSSIVETTWLAVYKYFMEAVDGIDNGKQCCHVICIPSCVKDTLRSVACVTLAIHTLQSWLLYLVKILL